MKVARESPLTDKESLAYKWDDAARRYFPHFEFLAVNQRQGLQQTFKNPLTNWRDISFWNRNLKSIDLVRYRQQLGDVSAEEVAEANEITPSWWTLSKSKREPGLINATPMSVYAVTGLSLLSMAYGKLARGYSIVWLVVPLAPAFTWYLYAQSRPPFQVLENAYRYIIAKRAATCELEAHKKEMDAHFAKYKNEAKETRDYLEKRGETLYHLEQDLAEKLLKGQLK